MLQLSRRSFVAGLFAAPAIISIECLMPVRAIAALIRPPATLWVSSTVAGWRSIRGHALALPAPMPNHFRTIAEAMEQAVSGDTILVGSGHMETVAVPEDSGFKLIGVGRPGHRPVVRMPAA